MAAMSENKVLVFPEAGEVDLDVCPKPEPGPSELLIKSKRAVVSTGTELTVLSNEYPSDSRWDDYGTFPFETGYSNIGEVIEVGNLVDQDIVGKTVATRSPHARYNVVDVDEYVTVPDILDEQAAFFALAAIAMNGVRRGRVDWGETAAIYGCGLIGQLAAQFCNVAGARPVVGLDILSDRLDYLPDDSPFTSINPETEDPVKRVENVADESLADVVFETTGLGSVVPNEFDILREPLGRLVVLSSPREPTTLDLHDHCNSPSYEIIGAHESSHPPTKTPQTPWTHEQHYKLFFELVADDGLNIGSLISHRVPFNQTPSFYRDLLEDRSDTMGIVIEWPDS